MTSNWQTEIQPDIATDRKLTRCNEMTLIHSTWYKDHLVKMWSKEHKISKCIKIEEYCYSKYSENHMHFIMHRNRAIVMLIDTM